MRPTIVSLLLALAATGVVASPKRQNNAAQSNATITATASTATSSSALGCNYLNVIGPNGPTVYTGCTCQDGDDSYSATQRAFIFNLTTTYPFLPYPACTRQLDNTNYPSVALDSGNPGTALCQDWISAGPVNAPWNLQGTPEMVPPFVGLCCTLGPLGVKAGCV